jgi:hypothetical protein
MAKSTNSKTATHYSELYGIPLGTIVNCRRRKWPLDDPEQLLRKFYESPGKKPDLTILETLACGTPTERVQSKKFTSNPDVPHLLQEVEDLRAECRRSFKDFEVEPSPIRRVPLHKVYLANLKALAALIPLATKAEEEADRLVSAEGVAAAWNRGLADFVTSLELVARRVATHSTFRRFDPVEVEAVVKREIDIALAQLRNANSTTEKDV